MQTKYTQSSRVVGVVAALTGVVSGVLYQYHEAVEVYRPNDVSNTIALYLLAVSVLFWAIFVVLWLLGRK